MNWKLLVSVLCFAFGMFILGCASAPVQTAPGQPMYKVNCYLGHIESLEVRPNGTAHFMIKIDRDECDENNRT